MGRREAARSRLGWGGTRPSRCRLLAKKRDSLRELVKKCAGYGLGAARTVIGNVRTISIVRFSFFLFEWSKRVVFEPRLVRVYRP